MLFRSQTALCGNEVGYDEETIGAERRDLSISEKAAHGASGLLVQAFGLVKVDASGKAYGIISLILRGTPLTSSNNDGPPCSHNN